MKKLILTLIVLAVLGGGAAAYYMRRGTPEPAVSTMQLTRGDIADTVQATGTLEAVETVDVGTQVSGVVEEMSVDYNSIVKKGQVIARLDPSIIQTQIEQARANVTRAEADLDRLRVNLADAERKYEQANQMWEKQLIPRDQLETAELNVKTQRSQIRSAEAGLIQTKSQLNTQQVNLGHTVIRAPIDGIVISRSVDQGQTVAASMNAPVLYVLAADLTKMQVIANIDEAEIGRMRPGQPVTFRVDAYPTETFRGSVQQVRLLPATVQNVVTYSTVISVPNPEYKLKPGMTANVTIEIARRTNVLRAPAAALRYRPSNDVFAALKQEVPADLNRGMAGRGGPGAGGGARGGFDGASGQQPAAAGGSQPGAAPAQPPQRRPEAAGGAAGSRPGGGDAGGDRPAGGGVRSGSGGGGRGNANLTPEQIEARRKQMDERMASMSPEERERFQNRMRDRAAGRDGVQREGGQPNGSRPGSGRSQDRQAQGRDQNQSTLATTTATSIDALFAPLVPTEGRGRLWLYANKQIKSINVRTGISDGTWTEILEGGDAAELQPGTEVVTNIVTGLEPQPRPGQQNPGASPLMPQRGNQRGGPGGRGR
jgi:HlyD family secretion protein